MGCAPKLAESSLGARVQPNVPRQASSRSRQVSSEGEGVHRAVQHSLVSSRMMSANLMSPVCVAHIKISKHTVQLVGDGVRGAAVVSVKERSRNTLYHLRDT